MNKPTKKSFVTVVFDTLGWPLILGVASCVGFYALIQYRLITHGLVTRYFTGHPVEYAEAAMFFVGSAALLLKALTVIGEFGTSADIEVVPRPVGGQSPSDAGGMLTKLSQLPAYVRQSYLAQRFKDALEFVDRKGAADGLDNELKHLADLDAVRQQESYALVRIIIWATPMLGFLGTVIGITLALGDLSPQALVSTPEKAMDGLLAGLSVAFDTTALALTLSVILMFGQFLTGRMETALLEVVDKRVNDELVGRFTELGSNHDPHVASVARMNEKILQTVEGLVHKQSSIWHQSLESSQSKWDELIERTGQRLETSLARALRSSIQEHATELAHAEEAAGQRAEHHWEAVHQVLTDNVGVMQSQQAELVKQGDIMLQVVQATGEVAHLQEALNNNLSSLADMSKLDETINSLAAAIHLLNARMGNSNETTRRIRLRQEDAGRRAA